MVNLDPTTYGPAFWGSHFGYSDFDSFAAAAEPLLDGFSIGPVSLPTEVLARAAWYSPESTLGSYLIVRFGLASNAANQPTIGSLIGSLINNAYTAAGENTMAQLIVPDCFQVAIEMSTGSRSVFNVIGVRSAGGTAAGAAAAVKGAWEGGSSTPLGRLPNQVVMVNYRATDISSANGDIVDLPSTTAGSVSTSTISTAAACALIGWNGGSRSRTSRGRLYYGPQPENYVNSDGRTLSTTAISAITATFNSFLSSLSTANYPLVVLSRKLQSATPVTVATVEATIATQRRRIRS
uniref:Uncharacterized protein n=1 Tax=uncultured prokaryote TaxID=198431 RepID=A0A0H5Q3M0_9ZZZZ|nr:hypothetical protein [uncultured prokaryote]